MSSPRCVMTALSLRPGPLQNVVHEPRDVLAVRRKDVVVAEKFLFELLTKDHIPLHGVLRVPQRDGVLNRCERLVMAIHLFV